MKICPNCGAELDDGSDFCKDCGSWFFDAMGFDTWSKGWN